MSLPSHTHVHRHTPWQKEYSLSETKSEVTSRVKGVDCKVLDKQLSRCSDHGVVVLFADADAVSSDGNMGDFREITEKGPFIERVDILLAWLRLHFLSVLQVVIPKVTVGLSLLEKHEVEHA